MAWHAGGRSCLGSSGKLLKWVMKTVPADSFACAFPREAAASPRFTTMSLGCIFSPFPFANSRAHLQGTSAVQLYLMHRYTTWRYCTCIVKIPSSLSLFPPPTWECSQIISDWGGGSRSTTLPSRLFPSFPTETRSALLAVWRQSVPGLRQAAGLLQPNNGSACDFTSL